MRLDKFVCKSTELTKTEATQRIHSGEASINGEIARNEATQVHKNKMFQITTS
ncbi:MULTISPECIES: S4 domain-containing protein [unclassified Cocleimonas]|uniref:S4 domain-containing protein n=1 Tax=unclassified Cocleimonas TaxID=2639732 RepID=UPI003FA3BD90